MGLIKKPSGSFFVIFLAVLFLLLLISVTIFQRQNIQRILISVRPLIATIPITPELVGIQGRKTYLVLFQNNMELRPGGGFIGSYGLVSFDKGKMGQFTIHNVYDADGQLRVHVEPYFIVRRHLQPHLYMRDSNFDVDFAKSASEAAFMLYKETGQHVDGVIAVDVSFLKRILEVIGPVYLTEYNKTVDANNFFLLTETNADRHSFPGSTQKQDFLRSFFENMKAALQEKSLILYPKFLFATLEAMREKHVVCWLSDPKLQMVLTENHLSSSLYDSRKQEPGTANDFLGINEANIGINKANYFLQRSMSQHTTIDPSGIHTRTIIIRTRSATW